MLKKYHDTIIRKDSSGAWKASDTYAMGMVDHDSGRELRLRVTTFKHNGVLVTSASAHILDHGFEKHAVHHSFSMCLASRHARCTEKAVMAQHDSIDVVAVLEQAKAHHLKLGDMETQS